MSITISTKLIIGVLVILLIGYITKELFSVWKFNLKQDTSLHTITDKLHKHLSKKEKKEIENEANKLEKDLENTLELNIFDIKEKDIM